MKDARQEKEEVAEIFRLLWNKFFEGKPLGKTATNVGGEKREMTPEELEAFAERFRGKKP